MEMVKRLYEGMFLVDSAQAAADWEGTLSVISTILQRADAEVVAMRKWQERKLAYDVNHKSRGTYILTYFKADSQRIAGIEKDVLLSEKVMRVLVLGTEKRPADMLKLDITGEPEEKPEEEAAEQTEAKGATATSTPSEQPKTEEKPAETPASEPAPAAEAAPAPEAPAEAPAEKPAAESGEQGAEKGAE